MRDKKQSERKGKTWKMKSRVKRSEGENMIERQRRG